MIKAQIPLLVLALSAIHCGSEDADDPLPASDSGVLADSGARADVGSPDTGAQSFPDATAPDADAPDGTTPDAASDAGVQPCDDDEFEPNDSPEVVTITRKASVVSLEGTACSGDRDYFAFEHLGGHTELSITGASAELFPSETEYESGGDPDYRLAGFFSQSVSATTGPALATLPVHDEDLPAGTYMVRVVPGPIPGPYTLSVTPECLGDFLDAADPVDDELLSRMDVSMGTEARTWRVICGADSDAFVYRNIVAGELRFRIEGAVNPTISVRRHDGLGADLSGVGEVPLAAPGDYTVGTSTNGGQLITIANAVPMTDYLIVVGSGAPADEAVQVYFAAPALSGPSNDTCGSAGVLVPDATATFGYTLGGQDDQAQSCGGDGAKDVYFRFNLAQQIDTLVSFDGAASRFWGTLALYQDPGACPADLTTLVPIEADGIELCDDGPNARLRAIALPAGDYLLAVDGINLFGSGTDGFFEVRVDTFPGGLPDICVPGRTIPVPPPGQSASYPIAYADLAPNERDSYPCSDGGEGNELLMLLEPTADVEVTIRTENGYDSILALFPGTCEAKADACNDDTETSLDSEFTANLVAGTQYYLYVDAYSASAPGDTTTLVITTSP